MMILNTCEDINRASELNLYKAALVGILLLQPSFTERQLYTRIASLSYSGTFPIVSLQKGDVRMGFGEDPKKVQNIVNNNYNGFKLLYRNVLKQLLGEDIITQFEDGFARTKDKEKVSHVLSHLPLHIRELMIKKLDGTFEGISDCISIHDFSYFISSCLLDFVRFSRCLPETFKGCYPLHCVERKFFHNTEGTFYCWSF